MERKVPNGDQAKAQEAREPQRRLKSVCSLKQNEQTREGKKRKQEEESK